MSPLDNREQIELWSGKAGERWVMQQEAMDRVVGPLGEAAMDAANVLPGERALDIGCGCGDTTLALGERIGPIGTVIGIDISKPMLARAQERVLSRTKPGAAIELFELDAAVAKLPEVDLAYSRFGLMFFADARLAFANLRRWARRLAFVTWRSAAENEWVQIPGQAIAPYIANATQHDPRAPGPFSLADKRELQSLLRESGFREISLEPIDRKLRWSNAPELAVGVKFLTQMGPAAKPLSELEKPARAQAIEAMSHALAPHQTANGLELSAAVWIVTAA